MFAISVAQRRRVCWGCADPIKKDTVCVEAHISIYSKSFHPTCFKKVTEERVERALEYEVSHNKHKEERNGSLH